MGLGLTGPPALPVGRRERAFHGMPLMSRVFKRAMTACMGKLRVLITRERTGV